MAQTEGAGKLSLTCSLATTITAATRRKSRQSHDCRTTSGAARPSCCNRKGTNERRSNADACNINGKPPGLIQRMIQSLRHARRFSVSRILKMDKWELNSIHRTARRSNGRSNAVLVEGASGDKGWNTDDFLGITAKRRSGRADQLRSAGYGRWDRADRCFYFLFRSPADPVSYSEQQNESRAPEARRSRSYRAMSKLTFVGSGPQTDIGR